MLVMGKVLAEEIHGWGMWVMRKREDTRQIIMGTTHTALDLP